MGYVGVCLIPKTPASISMQHGIDLMSLAGAAANFVH